jgi:hypothetical protein
VGWVTWKVKIFVKKKQRLVHVFVSLCDLYHRSRLISDFITKAGCPKEEPNAGSQEVIEGHLRDGARTGTHSLLASLH